MAMSDPYILGQAVTYTATTTDENDDPADPASIDLVITSPDGTETAYTQDDMTSDTVGTATLTVTLDQLGTWYARMVTVDPLDVAEDVLSVVTSYPVAS